VNGPIDDKELEKYLQRGSAVSQHYRALDSEDVPAEIDAAVIERASQAVREPLAGKRRAWRRWSVPVALAASTVLAISIVLESGVRHEMAVTSAPQAASEQEVRNVAPAPRAAESAAERYEALSTKDERSQLEAREPASAAEHAERQRALAPRAPEASPPAVESARASESEADFAATNRIAQPPPEPKVAAPANESDRSAPTSTATYQSVRAVAQRRAAPPAAASVSAPSEQDAAAEMAGQTGGGPGRDQEMNSKADETVDPEKWLQRIRELRQAGEGEQADREWRAFREAFPKYSVAEDDRALPPSSPVRPTTAN
jgi:hypothetical protein